MNPAYVGGRENRRRIRGDANARVRSARGNFEDFFRVMTSEPLLQKPNRLKESKLVGVFEKVTQDRTFLDGSRAALLLVRRVGRGRPFPGLAIQLICRDRVYRSGSVPSRGSHVRLRLDG